MDFFKWLLFGACIIISIYILPHLHLANYVPIKNVRIYGANQTDRQEIQTLLTPLISHGFFATKIDAIRDALLQMPWVSQVAVQRTWPDQVGIVIIEKKAIARWNEEGLLSERGELFTPLSSTYPLNLVEFRGPAGKQVLMLDYFNQMNRLLEEIHARISFLELTPYLTWKMTLDNGLVLQMGHKDILTRLNQFVKVYPKIVGDRASNIDYIDLRYSNGVAVRFKDGRHIT